MNMNREQVAEIVREEIDEMFSRLADRFNLKTGDVDPMEAHRWEEVIAPGIERYCWSLYWGNQPAEWLPDRVTGDWEPEGVSYPARITGRWSGGVEFVTDRATLDAIVARQRELRAEPGGPSDFSELRWEGDTLAQDAVDGETYRYAPDVEGLYHCGFGWSWEKA